MFKLGDKVKIKDDLIVGGTYGNLMFIHSMKQYLGKEATILSIDMDGDYMLDIDNETFYWDASMLSGKTIKEEESVRLAKAVCEYERIVSDLEEELHIERELNKHHEETIDKLISRYNALVHKYNNLLNYID